jgi:hypothetical protein
MQQKNHLEKLSHSQLIGQLRIKMCYKSRFKNSYKSKFKNSFTQILIGWEK